jgi:hypothetical protein
MIFWLLVAVVVVAVLMLVQVVAQEAVLES